MLNPETVAKRLGLSPENTKKLIDNWGPAKDAAMRVTSQADAMQVIKSLGIGPDKLKQFRAVLDSPAVKIGCALFFFFLNGVKQKADMLTNAGGCIQPPQPAERTITSGSNCDKFRDGIEQLLHKK